MNVVATGLDFAGKPAFQPIDEQQAVKSLIGSLGRNAAAVRSVTQSTMEAVSYRGEIQRATKDPGDPRVAGWTFLVNAADPRRREVESVLRPLAEHRGMKASEKPLVFNGEAPEDWMDWLHERYYVRELEGGTSPLYVMIVGGPDQVPFGFQSVLDVVANVGRVDFDGLDALKTYVEKVIRIENAPHPSVDRAAIMFAPDAGHPDPTYYSRKYMAEPMADLIQKQGVPTQLITGREATKPNLRNALSTARPAIVYTASHGLIAQGETLDVQRRYNGAICCQRTGPLTVDALFGADDVPLDKPFLEGAVFFQFACFGYGTPAESDYAHWLDGVPEQYTDEDFCASLPKALLAHPRGPIAYIGHLDTAFLHAFADPADPDTLDRWHARIAPFVTAIDELLGTQPSGLAMQDLNARYSVCNALITSTYDRLARGKFQWTPERERQFLDRWITRGDAQNYMVFGDPAVRLRMPDAGKRWARGAERGREASGA